MDDRAAAGSNSVDEETLWADPLWVALERAVIHIGHDPRVLWEKEPEYEGGLNITVINDLSAKVGLGDQVFKKEETYDGELTSDKLSQALAWSSEPRAEVAPLAELDWPKLARQTLDVYRFVKKREEGS